MGANVVAVCEPAEGGATVECAVLHVLGPYGGRNVACTCLVGHRGGSWRLPADTRSEAVWQKS